MFEPITNYNSKTKVKKFKELVAEEYGEIEREEVPKKIEESAVSELSLKEGIEKLCSAQGGVHFPEITSDQVLEVLDLTIKEDDENKFLTFLCMLSAYTENAQINLSFHAPSATGKSYIPTEIAQLFPQEDVIELGYVSPTAFFHDRAAHYDKEKNELEVDLSRKILIFLDQPHTLLLQHLRPFLSHDKKILNLKITDKSQKGGLRTKNIKLIGFPAVVFCTAGLSQDEQESTRFLNLSPEITDSKIGAGIKTRIQRETKRDEFLSWLDSHPVRTALKERIKIIKKLYVNDVLIKDATLIEEVFFNKTRSLKPRDQRDVGRLMNLVKTFALLNVFTRQTEDRNVIATEIDVKNAIAVWQKVSESQELNLPPYVYDLYKRVIVKTFKEKGTALTRKEIMQSHFRLYQRFLPERQLRLEILPMLDTAGLIVEESSPENKSLKLVLPLKTDYPTPSGTEFQAQDDNPFEIDVPKKEIEEAVK